MRIKMDDIKSVLTTDEMREIARKEFAKEVRRWVRSEIRYGHIEEVIGDVAHEVVWHAVDDAMNGDAKAAIAERIPKIIRDLNKYDVFMRGSKLYKTGNVGYGVDAVEAAVTKNMPLIESRVNELIGDINDSDISRDVSNAARNIVIARLLKEDGE